MAKFVDRGNLEDVLAALKEKFNTTEENLNELLKRKVNVEVCDTQYDFDQIKTKDNNTIYLIKGEQDTWAAKDYVDELFDLIVDLRSRVVVLESKTLSAEELAAMESPSVDETE